VLYRKARGKEAKLCFGGHVLMENRNGLCADFTLHHPIAQGEPVVALQQLDAHVRLYRGVAPKTVGADQGYYWQKFVDGCRERNISPHVASRQGRQLEGLDGRTAAKPGYQISQKVRKRIEEIFGWIKTVGGLRRSRYLGLVRTQAPPKPPRRPFIVQKELEFENEKARERENFRNRGFFNGLLIPFYQVPNFR
jgi:hypothetical protein